MDLSIITVSWNSRAYLAECIESARESAGPLVFEHFLIDNASNDGSADFVEGRFPHVTVLRNENNPGFAAANNIAGRRAKGRFLLFLNPDTKAMRGALRSMVRFLEANPDVGALGPKLLDAQLRWSPDMGDRVPRVRTVVNTYLGLGKLSLLFPSLFPGIVRTRDLTRVEDCEWVSGACLMVRREITEMELWCEDIFFSGEDIDYCDRIRHRGWRLVLTPEAKVIHFSGRSSNEQSLGFLAGRTSGLALCLKRAHGAGLALLGLQVVRWGNRLRYWKHRTIHWLTGSEVAGRASRRVAQFMRLDEPSRRGDGG